MSQREPVDSRYQFDKIEEPHETLGEWRSPIASPWIEVRNPAQAPSFELQETPLAF